MTRHRTTAAPGAAGAFRSGSAATATRRRPIQAPTTTISTPAMTPERAARPAGRRSGATGAAGGSTAPTRSSRWARPSPSTNAKPAAATQASHGITGLRRRRTRAKASTDATSAGRISVRPSTANTHPGITWPATVT